MKIQGNGKNRSMELRMGERSVTPLPL